MAVISEIAPDVYRISVFAQQPVVLVPILRRTFDGRLNVVAGT